MSYFYSKTTDSFYHEILIPRYKKLGSWPADCIGVSENDWVEFSVSHLDKKRCLTDTGTFKWIQKQEDLDSITQLERHWRNTELARADIALCLVQDSDPKAIGTVGQWRDYRKALRAWPEHADFPLLDKRPKAPDV